MPATREAVILKTLDFSLTWEFSVGTRRPSRPLSAEARAAGDGDAEFSGSTTALLRDRRATTESDESFELVYAGDIALVNLRTPDFPPHSEFLVATGDSSIALSGRGRIYEPTDVPLRPPTAGVLVGADTATEPPLPNDLED
jgi:hypothetical protein